MNFRRTTKYIYFFIFRNEYFQNYFLTCVIRESSKLDPDKRICLSNNCFRKGLLNFVTPSENKTFSIHDQVDIKLPTRFRLEFSHFREHKFW